MNMGNLGLLERRDCPSELDLDRLHQGELGGDSNVRRHVADCASCAAKLEHRDHGFAAMGVDADRLFARIEQRAAEVPSFWTRFRSLLTAPQMMIPAAALASVVALVLVRPDAPEPEVIRSKGSAAISVFRERGGDVALLEKSASFQAGDRVRFKVSLPDRSERSQIMVVGVESTGKTFTYYPANGSRRSSEPQVRPDGALAGAIELDAYQGEEWLHLVHCQRGFALSDLRVKAEEVEAPPECDKASFLMKRR